jgi:hypothetical protein
MSVKAVLLVLALPLPLAADELVLRNGAAFSGVVREEGEKVVIELDFGTMTFRKSEVRSIKKTDDPIKEFEQKLQAAKDARGYYEVAAWAREKGLGTRANELYRKVISLSPDHEGARKALGFERVEGKWLEGDDLMVARGLLKHNGRWLPKDTVEKIQENEKQVLIDSERRGTAERIAGLQREVELAKVQVERERLEKQRLERERADSDLWRWNWTNGTWNAWPTTRTWFTIPPPAQAGVQPAPVIIMGPAACPAPAPRPAPAKP